MRCAYNWWFIFIIYMNRNSYSVLSGREWWVFWLRNALKNMEKHFNKDRNLHLWYIYYLEVQSMSPGLWMCSGTRRIDSGGDTGIQLATSWRLFHFALAWLWELVDVSRSTKHFLCCSLFSCQSRFPQPLVHPRALLYISYLCSHSVLLAM